MGKNRDYTIEDWVACRKFFGLRARDVAEVLGLSEQSVRNVTSAGYVRKHGLPNWVITAIWTWKRMQEADMSREADLRDKLKQLIDGQA